MITAVAPHDPEAILQEEWLNSRGAIARFDRSTFEIRLLDVQEAPIADLAIALWVSRTIEALVAERWAPMAELRALSVAQLAPVLHDCTRDADAASVAVPGLLQVLGWSSSRARAGELWHHLADRVVDREADPPELVRALCDCLAHGRTFLP